MTDFKKMEYVRHEKFSTRGVYDTNTESDNLWGYFQFQTSMEMALTQIIKT